MKKLKELYFVAIIMLFSVSVMTVKADDAGSLETKAPSSFIEITEGPESAKKVSPVGEIYINKPELPSEDKMEYLGEFTITYYCACRKCNGKWGPIDGFGNPLKWGCVATDKKVIPMHTHLVIDGFDMEFEARDTGSGVNGKHIDIYVPVSHSEALRLGQGEKKKVWKIL